MTNNIFSPYQHQTNIDSILKKSQKCLIMGIGGGGDCISALHVRWALENCHSHVKWIHGGITDAPLTVFHDVELIDEVSAWVNGTSYSRDERLIEAVLSRWLGERTLLISLEKGVSAVVNSLNNFCKTNNIATIIFIDGGSDSLAYRRDTPFLSPITDTMALAAIAFGNFSKVVKYRVLGITVPCSDGDMTLDEFSEQLLKVIKAGGFLGGTFFPVSRLSEYALLIEEVLKEYPTGTALVPLQITNTPFKNPAKSFNPFTNGFQLTTFFLDAKIAATVGNDFARLVMNAKSFSEAKKIFSNHEKKRS